MRSSPVSLAMLGPGNQKPSEGVRSGKAVELSLGGGRADVRAQLTVLTDPGCVMSVSVAKAILHD
ncbi:hypothetical protein [Streptomyces sp. NPDC058613]|uniref:hypothetical protein n=1 Tax=Streptomyces sp. NPDC058613 TaxID=3346556 RepID=UPI0036640AF2